MKTYAAMNLEIVRLLRLSDGVATQYAAQRIEELEQALALAEGTLSNTRRALEVATAEGDAYRRDLEDIGKAIGCGHLEDGLARCVRDIVEKGRGK